MLMEPFKIIQRVEDLPDLKVWKNVVFDTETSGTSVYTGDRVCGIALGPRAGTECIYIPIRQNNLEACEQPTLEALGVGDAALSRGAAFVNLPAADVLAWLKKYAEDPEISWLGHNPIFDLGMFRVEGIEFAGPVLDTQVLVHDILGDLLNYGLDRLAGMLLPGVSQRWYAALLSWFKTHPEPETWIDKVPQNYSRVPIWLLGMYACEDIGVTRELYRWVVEQSKKGLRDRLPNQKNPAWTQRQLIQNDVKLTKVIFEMTWSGIRLDVPRTLELRERTLNEIEYFHSIMYRLSGKSFHVSGWKELSLAFERAGGKILYWTKKKEDKGKQKLDHFTTDKSKSTGRPCWNAAAILKYLEYFRRFGNVRAFEFVLAYREAQQRQRILSTYIDAYLSLCDIEGFVHCSFKQHGTRTGRLSSVQPNMQNVAKVKGNADSKAMDKFLAKLKESVSPDKLAEIQKGSEYEQIVLPEILDDRPDTALAQELRGLFIARPGCQLVSCDFASIEYRIAAYFSCDPSIIEKYRKDPTLDYHQLTSELMGVDRDTAKTCNFGLLYGMGPASLASALSAQGKKTTVEDAKRLINRLYDARPALRQMITNISQGALRRGYIQNPYGRVCAVAEDRSYVALNYLVQGTAGDMMRAAMVRVYDAIKKNGWPVLMLLSVHDELLFDIPTYLVVELAPKLAQIMCDVPEINLPILSDIDVGETWGSQIPFAEWKEKNCA